mgnify:FL=1
MIWIFVVLCAVLSFVIAAVSVGAVTAQQATKMRPAVFDLDEAVAFVGDALSPEVTARISYEDVRTVLGWHIDFLADKGVASGSTDATVGPDLVLVDEAQAVAYILGRVDDSGTTLTDTDVVEILQAQQKYYVKIGAIGVEANQ